MDRSDWEAQGFDDGKFSLGNVIVTDAAVDALREAGPPTVAQFLRRHVDGDWGSMPDEDKKSNDRALGRGGSLYSEYNTHLHKRVWVITDQDKNETRVLLPDEY